MGTVRHHLHTPSHVLLAVVAGVVTLVLGVEAGLALAVGMLLWPVGETVDLVAWAWRNDREPHE